MDIHNITFADCGDMVAEASHGDSGSWVSIRKNGAPVYASLVSFMFVKAHADKADRLAAAINEAMMGEQATVLAQAAE